LRFCQKICKTKRGLKRHITVKHKEVREDTGQKITTNNEASGSTLTAETLVGMVYDVKKRISEKKVFSDILRDELKSYQYEMDKESSEFSKLKQLNEALIKNGNEDKFFSKYYAEIALNATTCFEGLSCNAATLLSTKLADRLLAHAKEMTLSTSANADVKKHLSDKEKAGLQYLGGYILQKLHNKHRSSKSLQNVNRQCQS